MTNQALQPLDSRFSATGYFSSLGEFLMKFGESSSSSVRTKDNKTETICMSNTVCNQLWGLQDGEMVGMTTREVVSRVKDFVNLEEAIKKMEAAERQAIASNQQTDYTETALVYDGFVKIRKIIMVPLHGANGLSVATVAIGLDITQNVNLLRLLDIYNLYYPQPKALHQFSEYLNLKRYFITLPTFEELKTVLAMVRVPSAKDIAKLLNFSPKTVSNYLCSVKDKLKPNIDLHMIISSLRDYQQWEFAV